MGWSIRGEQEGGFRVASTSRQRKGNYEKEPCLTSQHKTTQIATLGKRQVSVALLMLSSDAAALKRWKVCVME